MRTIAIIAVLVASVFAQDATLLGNKPVVESRAFWGSNVGATLYITGNKYLRDSSGTIVVVDTTRNSVGSTGACTETIVTRTGTGVTPQSHFTLAYSGRATNVSADAIYLYLATRDRVPTGTDTTWVRTHYVYGDSIVPQTQHRSNFTTSYVRVRASFYAEGQDLRVCFARGTSGAPGNSDTVAITQVWPRGW